MSSQALCISLSAPARARPSAHLLPLCAVVTNFKTDDEKAEEVEQAAGAQKGVQKVDLPSGLLHTFKFHAKLK
eukprot:1161632-Pelagomonas_calceolata.AAC.2